MVICRNLAQVLDDAGRGRDADEVAQAAAVLTALPRYVVVDDAGHLERVPGPLTPFSQGRHSRGAGAERDYEKHNEAVLRGWRVLYVGPNQIEDGRAIEWVERALAQ